VKPDNGLWDLERLRSSDDPELHGALEAVKQQLPDRQQLAALAASLSQLGISVAPAEHATAATASSATRLKLLLGAGVVGPLAVALLLWRAPTPKPPGPAALAPTVTAAAQALAPAAGTARVATVRSNGLGTPAATAVASDFPVSPTPSPSAEANGAAATDNPPRPAASPGPLRSPPRAVAGSTPPAESVRAPAPVAADRTTPESTGPGVVARPTEVALLRDARLALGGSPAEALALAERHRTLFPRGAMVQERELIAISALARLGRHTAVLARAGQFERDFPNSPYRKQVSALAQ